MQADSAFTSANPQSFTERWLDGPSSTKFYTRTFTPPPQVNLSAVLVFIHGYIEHCARYTTIHSAWAQSGVAVFTYDMRGFGRTALDDDERSPSSAYGKTGGARERMEDVQWAVRHAHREFPDVPLFLMGHSMGGGLALSFATHPTEHETVALLSGVIASSPLVKVAKRAPGAFEFRVLEILAKVAPNFVIKTPVQVDDLSRDPDVGRDSLNDLWVKGFGRLEGLVDMINRGSALLSNGYKQWPHNLPVLILHGTQDQVNAFPPTKEFADLLQAPDKEFVIYEGMMHDLMTEPDLKERYFADCLGWVLKRLATSVASA